MIKKGQSGNLVKAIQGALGLKQSGDFDDALKEAVIDYQREKKLKPDGIVGFKTLYEISPSINLTENFTLREFIHSHTGTVKGISNMPNETEFNNIMRTAKMLQKVRDSIGVPIRVSSGFRSHQLNTAVGGSRTSAHRFGLACDISADAFGDSRDLANHIKSMNIDFDQLILEFPDTSSTWVHLGFNDGKQRRQLLTAVKRSGKTYYLPGLN